MATLLGVLGLRTYLQPATPTHQPLISKTAPKTELSVNSAVATPPPTEPVVTPAPAVTPNTKVAEPKNCVAPTYNFPSRMDLTNQPSGYSEIIDTVTYYQIYGNTSAQIKEQLFKCAPVVSPASAGGGSFAAETGSSLVWTHSMTAGSNGTCNISNVKVGLHVNMILPKWESTISASSGLARAWENLISNLTIHENGHVAINQQYAKQLFNDLQTMPATGCDVITTNIRTTAAADIAALNAANAAYDEVTNHGVNQGAVLR